MDRGRYDFGGGVYGEIYVKDNTETTALQVATLTQITIFDSNGFSHHMEPDHTNDHILIKQSGIYEAGFSIHLTNAEAQAQIIDVSLFANNGTEEFLNVHSHRLIEGGQSDIGSMSDEGIVLLAAGETIELWATSDSSSSKNVTFEDVTLNLIKLD